MKKIQFIVVLTAIALMFGIPAHGGILDITIIDGPDIQIDDSRRGTVQFTFDSGTIVTRGIQAPNAVVWAEVLLRLPAEVLLAQQIIDAENAEISGADIAALNEADIKQVALAYLRAAYIQGDPYQAYLRFDKFNTYRISQGWTIDQVVAALTTVGLTQEEWDLMKARYLYLANASRVAAMEAYQLVIIGDIWGAEFRQ